MDTPETRSRSVALISLLIEDVIAARERLHSSDTQTARRDIVRASLAAIEGMVWLARNHVHGTLKAFRDLTPIVDLALREQTYVVAESGKIIIQSRSVALPTAVKMVVSQAATVSPEITVDFSVPGWSDLKQSIIIRNRITHPKPESDLGIDDRDLEQVASGLSWLTATIDYVMSRTNLALTEHNQQLRDIAQRLRSGDPEALSDYRSALTQIGDDDD